MAAKRGKSQAKRTQGNGGGIPGWAWGIAGLLLGIVLILVAPRYLKSDGDGFFRPHPDPDAQPAPVESEPDVVDEAARDEALARPVVAPKKAPDFDFYTVLPGKEVPLSDAELAARAKAEAQANAPAQPATPAADADAIPAPLPAPVSTDTGAPARPAAPAATASTASTTPADAAPAPGSTATAGTASDSTRYLLQAGAFEASGQAEELKAKIALLGLGARVEAARLGGRTVYRVRMGPYGTASELAEAKRKLASGGLPGMAIKVE